MPKTALTRPTGMHATNGYSHAVAVNGLLFLAGQVALDGDGTLVGAGDCAAQARQAFANIGAALSAAGAGFGDLVRLTSYLRDIDDLPALGKAWDEVVDAAAPPVSTAVQVAALFRPDVLVEIEAVAVLPTDAAAGTLAVPMARADAVAALTEDRALLTAAVDGLSPEALTAPYRPGGRPLGDAAESLRDLVAHVSMWDEYGLAVLQEARRGRRHWTASDTVDGARLNRAGVAAGRELAVAEVLARHRRVLTALLDELDRITDEEWSAPVRVPGEHRSLGGYAAEHLSVPGQPPFRHVRLHLPSDLLDDDNDGRE